MPRKASQDSDDKKAASKNKKKTGSKSKQQKTSGEKLWDKKFDKMFGPQKKEQGLEINISLGEDPKKEFPIKAPLGTKIGPGRKDIPANPHGVDDDTIYLQKGGPVDTPKKKRGNYGPNIGKPFKAMGPVGGLPVNKSGTKIMAGRLAKRGYGKAR